MDELHREAGQRENPQEHQKHSKYANVLIGVLAVIVGILLIAILQNGSEGSPTGEDAATAETPDAQLEAPPAITFDYLLVEDWDLAERAEKGVQELARGQKLDFGIVTDPTDEKFVFFATSVFDSRKQENLVGVYKYNTENYQFERLFRRTYSEGDFSFLNENTIPNFHVVGYDDGQLIILAQDMDDSPGPCASPLLLGSGDSDIRTLVSLSIDDPYAGFSEYTPPQEVLDDAEATQQTCEENL